MKEDSKQNLYVDKCLTLYQAREKEKGHGKELLNRQRLGRILYPNTNKDSSDASMWAMCSRGMKRLPMPLVGIITNALGVDANFLFGQPSAFDQEYERLCGNKEVERLQSSIEEKLKADNTTLTLDKLKAIEVVINGK